MTVGTLGNVSHGLANFAAGSRVSVHVEKNLEVDQVLGLAVVRTKDVQELGDPLVDGCSVDMGVFHGFGKTTCTLLKDSEHESLPGPEVVLNYAPSDTRPAG